MQDIHAAGIVFNIQKFSVHDGRGIRTLVFLKGCPLRCAWCSNPESQKKAPERAFNTMRCLGAAACGRCARQCPSGAMHVADGTLVCASERCVGCFACTRACPSGAQTLYGEDMSVEAVLRRVEEDGAFYARSGGGLTLSGGEAMAQPHFVKSLLREARRRHIHTTMETCGYAAYEDLAEATALLGTLIYDLKHADTVCHKKGTGVGNEVIVDNFRRLCADFPSLPVLVRTPVIPGFNDAEEDILAIRRLIPKREGIAYELLSYHRMGQPKYSYLGRGYALDGATADESRMRRLRELAQAM